MYETANAFNQRASERDCSLEISQGVIDIDMYAVVSNLMRFYAIRYFLLLISVRMRASFVRLIVR